ncbi:MAG: hypothetical protein M3R62_15365 [Acidobacteriota bacterium]|nr:hypothetical protein [Acidobacteriota bacterium]
MVRLGAALLVLGVGAELVGLLSQAAASASLAPLLGFVTLTLSLILLILGLPSIRNLVG